MEYRGYEWQTKRRKECRDWNDVPRWIKKYPNAGLDGKYCR